MKKAFIIKDMQKKYILNYILVVKHLLLFLIIVMIKLIEGGIYNVRDWYKSSGF